MHKQITPSMADDLDKLMKMNLSSSDRERSNDIRQLVAIEILKGKPLEKALRHARADFARELRWGGITPPVFTEAEKKQGVIREKLCPSFTDLDREEDGDFSLHERVAAADPEDIVAAMEMERRAVFDDATEATLQVVGESARWIGQQANCCIRTAKTKRKKLIEEYAGRTAQMPLFEAEIAEVLE